jgi:NCS1 family nucleobase:cation symporter-1
MSADPAHGVVAAADTSGWPLLPSERTWGPWQLGIALATAAAATWCYIIGEYTGSYLGFTRGAAALTAGSMIGMLLVTLAAVPISIRFGVDSIVSCKPQFGTRGWIIPALLQYVSILGWNSLLLIFFAKSTTQLLIAVGAIRDASSLPLVPATTALACLAVFVILLKGSSGVDRMAKILVFHVFLGCWMLYILTTRRWDELLAAVPPAQTPDRLWNYTTGIEIGISSLLGWWPYIGAMVRMAPNGRTVALPIMLGMGAPVPLLSLIGIAGILVLRASDPAEWLRTVGGLAYGIVALIFVAAANLGTTITGVYASAIGLRQIPGVDRIAWPHLLLLTLAPIALVGLFIPDLFFTHFNSFIAFIGVGFAPLCGIQIVDYYVLRRRQVDIRAAYEDRNGAPYRYVAGFNPAALAAMLVGFVAYIYLLDPISYVSRWPYQYLTASLPTALVSALVYWVVTRVWVMPQGLGGYPPR